LIRDRLAAFRALARGTQARRRTLKTLAYLWAGPNSLLGLTLLPLALAGGRVRQHRGTLEASGGALRWALGPWAEAITLGHVILARNARQMDRWRAHERRHVRQYERWGPLFLPAYALFGMVCLLRGRSPYREHPFEMDAGPPVRRRNRP
jgi:hypothetical protein